jgi:hypothetical protein
MMAISEPTGDLPATILHRAPGTLYVDRNSCPRSLLQESETETLRM